MSGWFKPKSKEEPRPTIEVEGTAWPVRLVPHPRSRRYRLVFDAARGELRLTMPQRGSKGKALAWAAQQSVWIGEQTAKAALPMLVEAGVIMPYRGQDMLIHWDANLPRAPRLLEGRLEMGGSRESVARRTQAWLKAEAQAIMTAESRALAESARLPLGRVGISDPRSRWGSCTANGDLRYSWRLIFAPDHVRRATVAHEVAHLRHMDHSAAFHAFVDQLHDGDVGAARQWLRAHGRDLHRYRFSA